MADKPEASAPTAAAQAEPPGAAPQPQLHNPLHGKTLEFIVTALDVFEVHILSSRSHQWGGKRAMKRYLREHLVDLGYWGEPVPQWWTDEIFKDTHMEPWDHEVRSAADRVIAQIKWPWFKPPAMVTLDDRAMTFSGQWPTLTELMRFKPWNKP